MDLQDMNGKQGSSCIKFSICSQKWEDSLDIQLFQQEKLAGKGRNDSFFKAVLEKSAHVSEGFF